MAIEYVENITGTVTSFWHGMSITLSHLFRRPMTIQYPDTPYPLRDTLPPRYRGFLEVDIDICTGCLACEKACPINCIKIAVEKDPNNPKVRQMTQFDLDEAKCMFCGLCVEPCPTGAIQHTREFEGSVVDLRNLTFRWVDPARPSPLYKVPKGTQAYLRKPLGSLVRTKIKAWDAPGPSWVPPPKEGAAAPAAKKKDGAVDAAGLELAKRALGVDKIKLQVILEEAQAGTDCGECTYPTCHDYSQAMASGKEARTNLCSPGGAETHATTQLIIDSWKTGKVAVGGAPAAAAPAAAPATPEPPKP
ncbi:MAG: NuoI/complex I 23 kDa subunit family protein [Myxococcales bacterium]